MSTSTPAPRALDLQADLAEIRHALDLLAVPGGVIEIRALDVPAKYGKPITAAGYFIDRNKAAQAAAALDTRGAAGVYLVLNEIHSGAYARAPERVIDHFTPTTGDSDILRRRWLPLDFDPPRPAGVSASEDEHCAAEDAARSFAAWLASQGWPTPIRGDSGNGAHLLYRIDLPAVDGGLVQGCIEALADRFSGPSVDVDRRVFNASRVFKLYGTTAGKGFSIPEDPTGWRNWSRSPSPSRRSPSRSCRPWPRWQPSPSRREPRPAATAAANRSQVGWTFPDGLQPAE